MLDPHTDAPWLDHFIDSPTYAEPVQQSIDLFIKTYGTSP